VAARTISGGDLQETIPVAGGRETSIESRPCAIQSTSKSGLRSTANHSAPQLMASSDPPRAPAPFPHLAALASRLSSRQMEGESDDRKLPWRALPIIPLEKDLDLELKSRTSARSIITLGLARARGQVQTSIGDSRPSQKELRSTPWSDRKSLLSATPSHYYSTMSRVQPAIPRLLSSTKRQIASTSFRLARPNPKHVQAPPPPTFTTGHRIPHRTVQLVDPKSNQLLEPAPLQSIKYDKTTHELRLVSDSPPVVKLIDRAEEAEKAKLLEIKLKMNRKTAFEEKEVQISWASADGDLQHKLDVAKGFLERGDRVNLVFAPKASGTPTEISQSRKEDMIAFFESGMQEYGTTWRDRETTKTTDVIYWQAKSDIMKEKKVKVSEAELEKKRLKDEKKEARRRKEEERKLKAAGKQ
jgi:translation initiation factor IF-3